MGPASCCYDTTIPLGSVRRCEVVGGLISLEENSSDDSDSSTSYSPKSPSVHEEEMENEIIRQHLLNV